MAQHDFTALLAQYPALIAQMPDPFTSHEFIQRLSEENQQLYIEALHSYRHSHGPFKTVHQQFSNRLNDFSHLVRREPSVSSTDIWGNQQWCASWSKVPAPVGQSPVATVVETVS